MKKLYLTRHGQTVLNTEGKVQGWTDSPLTEAGKKQATQIGELLRKKGARIDASFSSDLQRAVDTMQIAGLSEKMFATPMLREISFGILDGTDALGMDLDRWDEVYSKFQGESIDDCLKRVYQSLNQIMAQPDIEQVFVVSHGFPVASMYQILPKDPSREWKEREEITNGTILEYDYDENGFILREIHRVDEQD